MKVWVTGGCGDIGRHTGLALQAAGIKPVVVDNRCNSQVGVLARIAAISRCEPLCYQREIGDPARLDRLFGESTRQPLEYDERNLGKEPQGIPNLMPFLTLLAIGRHDTLSAFGNDYPTVDGTGARDDLHGTFALAPFSLLRERGHRFKRPSGSPITGTAF